MPQNSEAQAFIDRILALPKGPGVSLEPALQPSIDDEAELRRLFATEKDHTRLKDPYVGLVDVFDAPPDIRLVRARVVKDEEDLKAKHVMPLSSKDRKPEGAPAMVPSLEEFQKNWAVFSEGSLSQLADWNNVIAAGGSVLACLMPLPEEAKVSKRAMRKYYHASAYPTSDVDLFLWGLNPEQAEAKIIKIYEAVRDSVPWDVTCVRTKHTVSIHSQYPYRSVQIVLRLYSSPAEILAGFDIDAPCCAYDGSHVWANPRAITALMRQCNTVDVTRRSPSYEVRLTKYSSRAFEIYVPNLSRTDIDPTIYERSIVRIEGLARLLVFEKLKSADSRASFLQSRRTLRGRPFVYNPVRRKRGLKGDLKNQEAIGGLEMNDYDVVSLHIPYGPGWDARRIDKLVYQTDLGMNSTFNPKNKDRRLHRHPAFFGTIQECMEDCCECCPKPIDEDERKLQEEEDKQFIRGKISFIEEDPGRQSLSGSFNPIDDTEWGAQVYLGPTEKFFQAIVACDRAAVGQMIVEGVDVNRRDHVGRMPLHVAVLAKAEDIACDLIDAGARITSRLADGKTALHWAVQLDQVIVVKKLLAQSQSNQEKLKTGDEEDGDGDVEMIDVGKNSSEDDWSSGDDGVISMEEDADADGEDDDMDGEGEDDDEEKKGGDKKEEVPPETPAESGALPEDNVDEPDVFDIDAADWDLCFTPLSYAILFASMPVIDVLLEAGADPQMISSPSYDNAPKLHPLLLTMYRPDEEQATVIIERLLKAGVVSSSADDLVKTILHKMIEAGKTKLVHTLLKMDPKAQVVINLPSMMNRNPIFPIITAHQLNDYAMIATLLAYGAKAVFDVEDITLAQDILSQQQQNSGFVNHYYNYGNGSAEPLDQIAHPVEVGISGHSDLFQLFIALGASVNRATKQSLGAYGRPEMRRTYLDWVRFAIAWLEKGIIEEKKNMEWDAKTLGSVSSASSPWKTFVAKGFFMWDHACVPGSEKAKEMINEKRTEVEKKIRSYNELKGFFGDAERLLVSKGAKTFTEVFPDSESTAVATQATFLSTQFITHARNATPNFSRYIFMGQHEYDSREPVPSHLNEKYEELFEACWKGDNDTVRKLCLPEETKQNALRVSVMVAHPTNQWVRQFFTPLAAAIEGRHWSTVRLVFGICVAQYKPAAEKEVAFKIGNIRLEDDDDDDDGSDDGSEASDETVAAKKNNQPFIDVAQVSSAVKVPVSPSRILINAPILHESGHGYDLSSPLVKAVRMKDFEAFVEIGNLYKLVEPPIDFEEDVLDAILRADQPEMLDEYIRRTGRNIEFESSHGDDATEKEIMAINDKNKLYLGLSVHGKKRKDLAKKNDPDAVHHTQENTVPVLWRAIQQSASKIVEYLNSARPLEAYRFYAMTNSNEMAIRLRRMTDLEKVLPSLLGWNINAIGESPLTTAVLSQNLDMIKLLFAKKPKLIWSELLGLTISDSRIKFSGWSPLMIAARVGCDSDTIDFLLANGQSPLETDQVKRWNVYHALAAQGQAKLLEHLLKKLPRDVNEALLVQQSKGALETPLHLAVSARHYRISSAIIDYTKAGLMMYDVSGSIPLHIAVANSQVKTVQKLVDNSPPESLFTENGVGNTPLEIATLYGLFHRVVNLTVSQPSELPASWGNTNPPRINLDKLSENVPALRKAISELSSNGPLKPGDKLTEELSAFARLMETKLAAAKAEAAQEKKEPKTEEELEKEKWNDFEDKSATLKILQEAALARPMQRQLIHLIDVQKSVGSDLNSAMRQSSNVGYRRSRKEDEEGLEPEDDSSDMKLRNSSLIYKRFGQPIAEEEL
ncbi:hypothetical protein GYMLUDRAFT_63236 [Collybiopsis luxurians FD-317 M1]|uniref:Ankyrin repeat protein n=1 Tax=Collybiopsis luxurians FD-317 M1 TaxID=944289 RepID=A0A0D0AVA5_9AGAR|nr:hypothetical protein GYMLUDRAFT_63236 [Collybiopsis luxurians FD-317 M1]